MALISPRFEARRRWALEQDDSTQRQLLFDSRGSMSDEIEPSLLDSAIVVWRADMEGAGWESSI